MNHLNNIKYYVSPKKLVSKEPPIIRKFEVDWKKNVEEILLIYREAARERVQDTIRDHYEISKKYFSFLMLTLSITSVLFAYILSSTDIKLTSLAFVSVIICSLVILILAQNIRPVKFRAPGRVPEKAIRRKTLDNPKVAESEKMKLVLYQELINCQAQIDLNQFYNNRRLDALDFIIRLLMISFIIICLFTVILKAI